MDNKKFKMIDEGFRCRVCKKDVLPLSYTARDHCPYCLCSLHVDINPGDRACLCKGILRPIGLFISVISVRLLKEIRWQWMIIMI